ncbi:MAG: DNA repair protein RecN [Oscillatoriales cyanobacterium SM2_2_1]|nr:DNA repair protein RecN [Oscillatoriales cyanobacterium SM2_2_1]
MLRRLRIENFALIERLEWELGEGLHILTGETGAGKSIILDAVDGVLGGKVTAKAIRTGCDRALLEADFSLDGAGRSWLASHQLPLLGEDMLTVSREVTARSPRSRVNGVVVNRQQILELRDHLIVITAQGQTFLLAEEWYQRQWLDEFGGPELQQSVQQVKQLYERYQRHLSQLEAERQQDRSRLQQADLWRYQLRELTAADLELPTELEDLERDRHRLSHTVELQRQSYEVYELLYQGDRAPACAEVLGKAEGILEAMAEVDGRVQGIWDLVASANAQITEASRQLRIYGDQLDTDPDSLEQILSRIAQLRPLLRKYGSTLAEVIAHRDRLTAELDHLEDFDQHLATLEASLERDRAALTAACAHLTQLRQRSARALEQSVVPILKKLAMQRVQFAVTLSPIAPTPHGGDRIVFEFSPNPGEPLQSLAATASGGEMSRFLLALQTCLSQSHHGGMALPTLVFDEIDVGVSGKVAQTIAHQLWQIGRRHQVLCVTHQPIVAAIADHHYQVSKHVHQTDGIERTAVHLQQLSPEARKDELAQLAGGDLPSRAQGTSNSAIAFAESLLHQANTIKAAQHR